MKLGSEHQSTPSPLRRRSSLQPSLTGSQQSSAPSEEALSTVRVLSSVASTPRPCNLQLFSSACLTAFRAAGREPGGPRVLLDSSATVDCAGTLCALQAVGHLESIVHSPAACAQYSRIQSASQRSSGAAPLELVGPQVSLDLMRPSSRLRVG